MELAIKRILAVIKAINTQNDALKNTFGFTERELAIIEIFKHRECLYALERSTNDMKSRRIYLILSTILVAFSFSTIPQARAEVAFDFALKTDYGSIKSADQAYVQSSSMLNYGLVSWLGYRLPVGSSFRILLGGNGQFELMRQITDPAAIGGTNIYGSCYVLGVGGGVQYGRIQLLGSYDLLSQFSLGAATASASASAFKKGTGYRAEFRYELAPHYFLGLHYGSLSFKSQSIGASDLDLSANAISLRTYGVSVGYSL